MIELDGAYGEGGGALVRVALALSTLSGKEFSVKNIRAGRPKSGLKAQHLTAIEALRVMSGAHSNKTEIGTTELYFKPGRVKRGRYEFDIGTAGSISLFLQAVLIPCIFAKGKVSIVVKGGTCGKWQAGVDYTQNVLLPHLNRFVDKISIKILKRGYYPKGGGEVEVKISPRFFNEDVGSLLEELALKCSRIELVDQGKIEQVRGVVNCSMDLQDNEVCERIENACKRSLKLDCPKNISLQYANSRCSGGEVLLWGIFGKRGVVDYDNPVIIASSVLLEKSKRSEQVGIECAKSLIKEIESGAACDEYLADQLIAFMGLLPGSVIKTSKVSKHCLTNIYVVEKFLPVGFKVDCEKIESVFSE
jgi:RNA 3'-terminal phosphate cyclase (ATP)